MPNASGSVSARTSLLQSAQPRKPTGQGAQGVRGCHYALRECIPGVSLIGGQHPEEKVTLCESGKLLRQLKGNSQMDSGAWICAPA